MVRTITAFLVTAAVLSFSVIGFAQTGTFSGTVADVEGNPLAGVSITLMECTGGGWGGGGWGGGGWGGGWGTMYQTESIEDGTFIIESVEAGEYNATAWSWEYGMEFAEVEIAEGETVVVDFVLEEWSWGGGWGGGGGVTGSLAGTVVDAEGNPVEGAFVSVYGGWGGGWGGGWNNATTLADGSFEIEEIEIGEYTASATAWEYGSAYEDVEILEGETTTVTFVLEEWSWGGWGGGWGGGSGVYGTVSGTVTDLEGNPVEGAGVKLYSSGGWGGWSGGWYETETAEDGTYNFDEVETGVYNGSAIIWEIGCAYAEVEVFEGLNTVADFVLEEWSWGGGGWGGWGGWSGFETVELSGIAMVEETAWCTSYSLDVDGDDVADYTLNFGPPDYDPQSGAVRPEDGEEIDIVGGMIDWGMLPWVSVYEINGLFWQEPFGTDSDDYRKIARKLREHQQADALAQTVKVKMSSYPNPFNPETTITYELTEMAMVNIAVYNSLGQRVAQLVDSNKPAGIYQMNWNAANYSSGYYFLNINAGGQTMTQKLLLMK